MAAHDSHHYVPRFLLQGWHTPPDDKLSTFSWVNGRLLHARYTAKHVAKSTGLYALREAEEANRNFVERDYFGPIVDKPGAVAHKQILAGGVRSLAEAQKTDWARFLVAQMLRVPDMIDRIRERGRAHFEAELRDAPAEYDAIRGDDPDETLFQWVASNAPMTVENFAMATLPTVVESELLNGIVLRSIWATRDLSASGLPLFISDRAMLYGGRMDQSFLLALPLSPTRVFMAFNRHETWDNIVRETDTGVVERLNLDSVTQATTYVYATDAKQHEFVERHLRKPSCAT